MNAHKYVEGCCDKPFADKVHVVITNPPNTIEYQTTYETHWDYSANEDGDGYRYCPECGEPIEEDDYVTVVPMNYYGKTFLDVYHHNCFDE